MYKVTISFRDTVRPDRTYLVDVTEAPNLFDMATGEPVKLVVFSAADGTLHQFHAQDIFHISKKLSTAVPTGPVPGMYGINNPPPPGAIGANPYLPKPTPTVNTGGMATDFGAIADAMRKKGIN
jgi:hypothetical protein